MILELVGSIEIERWIENLAGSASFLPKLSSVMIVLVSCNMEGGEGLFQSVESFLPHRLDRS